MSDPGTLGRGSLSHQLEQAEGQTPDQQRLQCDGDQDRHYWSPLALRARAIICSSLSSSSSLSLPDMPSNALAALAGEPLKKTRTMSLSADFFATESDRTGLYIKPRSDSPRWTKPLSSSRLSIALTAEPLRRTGSASQMSATGRGPF